MSNQSADKALTEAIERIFSVYGHDLERFFDDVGKINPGAAHVDSTPDKPAEQEQGHGEFVFRADVKRAALEKKLGNGATIIAIPGIDWCGNHTGLILTFKRVDGKVARIGLTDEAVVALGEVFGLYDSPREWPMREYEPGSAAEAIG